MKVIIAGSRSISSYNTIVNAVNKSEFKITEIVSGNAKGVDSLGEQYGKDNGIRVKLFPAAWDDIDVPGAIVKFNRYGKKYNAMAGHMRNAVMAEYAHALIAVWDGRSKGTLNMIQRMQKIGKLVFIYNIMDF